MTVHAVEKSWTQLGNGHFSQVTLVMKNPPANGGDIRDMGSIPGPEDPQYSCLENPMDRGAWWATIHGIAGS